MTTYTLSRTSPLNTVLTDPEGKVSYVISSPFQVGNSETTIKRGDHLVATIHWKIVGRNMLTMNDKTTTVKEVFPKSKKLSLSRVWTMPDGSKFKWKGGGGGKLYCVAVETGLNMATYDRTYFHMFRDKPSTLDIAQGADQETTDALVVTWAYAEKKARDVRRARRNNGGGS